MTRYLTGNRSTKKLITVVDAHFLQPRHKGRKAKSPPAKQAQKPNKKNNNSQSPATRLQGNEGQPCVAPSTQSKNGVKKPIIENSPSARNQLEKVSSRSLNERFTHLLALKSYTLTELYNRISREGMKEWERSILPATLKRVAFLMDGSYHLREDFRKDVHEDWPYYTKEEKAMLKIRKPQNLTAPSSSDGSSGRSPNSTQSGSSPTETVLDVPEFTYKRLGHHEGNDGTLTKRPRMSHYKKFEEPKNNTTMSSGDNLRTADSSSGGNSGDKDASSAASTASATSVASATSDASTASAADHSFYDRNTSDTPSSCIPNLSVNPIDYLTQYTTISSVEQRLRYKAAFNANYDEYKGLHDEAMNVWQRIANLEEQLNQVRASGNQKQFEEMRQRYILEHSRTKNDPVRVEKERRFYYLHNKLDHIQRLVTQYDTLNDIANMLAKERE